MTKADFDASLKDAAVENNFTIDGDYLVFDKNANLSYKVLTYYTLGDLKSACPIGLTRLNKNLLVSLENLTEQFDAPFEIRASFHSSEYHLTGFGCFDSDLYLKGDALDIGCTTDKLDALILAAQVDKKLQEIGIYKWGVHIGWTKEAKTWDKRTDESKLQFIKDLITNDKMKNILLLGAAAAAGWWFFIRKK